MTTIARPLAPMLLAVTILAACATNPVTGRRELALVSQQQEIQMGQQGAQEVVASIGLVDDAELQRYVERVGMALAKRSERPDLPWSFRVVDDPVPNAFALPGGPIFVTRGLLALMQNEAELASVLGHEIGHVTARHSVRQISRQQAAQVGLVVGAILSPQVAQYGDLLGQGLQLAFLKYGRDDEREADAVGFRYAYAQGYDVREFDDVFEQLRRVGESQDGGSPVPSWLSTHPDPGERVETTRARVAALGDTIRRGLRSGEADFVRVLDGLVYGEDPRQGYVEGGRFLHPQLRFQFTLPQGWRVQNTPQAVIAAAPQGDAVLQLTVAPGAPEEAARRFLSQQGMQPGQAQRTTINGLPAVAAYFSAQTEQQAVEGLATFVAYGGTTYQFLAFGARGRFAAVDGTVRATVGSFAPLTDAAALARQPDRLRVVRVAQPTTPAQLARTAGNVAPAELLALLNQAASTTSTIPAGANAKTVVRAAR